MLHLLKICRRFETCHGEEETSRHGDEKFKLVIYINELLYFSRAHWLTFYVTILAIPFEIFSVRATARATFSELKILECVRGYDTLTIITKSSTHRAVTCSLSSSVVCVSRAYESTAFYYANR
jgi:hypothetical protein